MESKKTFVVINTHFIGDTILTNSLVQNIKRLYENSKVVMVTSPALAEIAKYLKGVDEVYVWDRFKKDHGFINNLKFILKFPYKRPYAAFPIYGTDRPVLISKLIGAKYILCPLQKFFSRFRNSKYPIDCSPQNAQEQIMNLLTGITKEKLIDVPIIMEVPDKKIPAIENLQDYIVIIPTSTRTTKEFPIEMTKDIISNLQDNKIVFLGSGKFAKDYSEKLAEYNFENLIDLSGKTSLEDAAVIIKNSKAVIASDTGLMHMSCALQKPTLALFFEQNVGGFMPKKELYNCNVICDDYSIENIMKNFNEITGKKESINV